MELRPILSAMRRNKFGALLIAAQMAVTLAFLANAITLVEQRTAWSARPSGVDEKNVFVISTDSMGHSGDLAARQAADIAALRALPGVLDAFTTNMFPMQGGGWVETVSLTAKQKTGNAMAAYYMGDEHALTTLGLTLIAGRNFLPEEAVNRAEYDQPDKSGVIVTKVLAERLFPAGNALGQPIFVESDDKSTPIIGIVDRLQGPFTVATGLLATFPDNSVLAPFRLISESPQYMVRSQPGQLDAVMKAAEAKLLSLDDNRILRGQSMLQIRSDAYRGDRGLIVLLVAVCTALLIVTAFGIIGLTSYWVAVRRQQIGIRRALGATRLAIVHYFQTENLLIAGAGAAAGVACAIALNLWMVRSFEMVRMDNSRVFIGALVMLLLGQAAVLWPALRAASIPPALATRGG
jgi:putative ABC transport system permease protein